MSVLVDFQRNTPLNVLAESLLLDRQFIGPDRDEGEQVVAMSIGGCGA